jgi:hypothetical protein
LFADNILSHNPLVLQVGVAIFAASFVIVVAYIAWRCYG